MVAGEEIGKVSHQNSKVKMREKQLKTRQNRENQHAKIQKNSPNSQLTRSVVGREQLKQRVADVLVVRFAHQPAGK